MERTSSVTDVTDTFRTLICEELAPISPEELTDDVSLTDGILDSFALVVVFEHIEQAIGRELRDEERVRDTVRTLSAIADFVNRER